MDDKTFIKELIDIKSKSLSIDGSEEVLAILNLNLDIEFATVNFQKIFISDEPYYNKSFTSLSTFQAQSTKLEKLLNEGITTKSFEKFIYFIIYENILQAKLFEIRPIINRFTKSIAAIAVSVSQYNEYGLIFHGLKQNNISTTALLSKTSFSKRKQKKHIDLLTDFQLTICYLVVHHYPNERIADIINQLDINRERYTTKSSTNKDRYTTRAAINTQIEKIRELYSIPSKEALIEFLNLLNLQSFLPKSLFNRKLIIVD